MVNEIRQGEGSNKDRIFEQEDEANPAFIEEARLVDAYDALNLRKQQNEEEIRKLKEEIVNYSEKRGTTTLTGSSKQLFIKKSEMIKCSLKGEPGRLRLEEIIKNIGKWEEVSILSTQRLSKIFLEKKWKSEELMQLESLLEIGSVIKLTLFETKQEKVLNSKDINMNISIKDLQNPKGVMDFLSKNSKQLYFELAVIDQVPFSLNDLRTLYVMYQLNTIPGLEGRFGSYLTTAKNGTELRKQFDTDRRSYCRLFADSIVKRSIDQSHSMALRKKKGGFSPSILQSLSYFTTGKGFLDVIKQLDQKDLSTEDIQRLFAHVARLKGKGAGFVTTEEQKAKK